MGIIATAIIQFNEFGCFSIVAVLIFLIPTTCKRCLTPNTTRTPFCVDKEDRQKKPGIGLRVIMVFCVEKCYNMPWKIRTDSYF
jgi:hypothetical protein